MTGQKRYRIGQGLDVHPLVEGRPLVLGGVRIPFERGLKGHSDADALLHAVVDALLGAAGQGDIGTFFPDTDLQWKDADSTIFLKTVGALVEKLGWQICNIDCTILAQVPRLNPYIPGMKEHICKILNLELNQCAIKATTSERLGFIGREEGILASATVLLESA